MRIDIWWENHHENLKNHKNLKNLCRERNQSTSSFIRSTGIEVIARRELLGSKGSRV